jgi:AcrR family transcriptional regulator
MTIASSAAGVRKRLGRPKNSSVDIADAMLKAALELFSAQNYSAVTIKDIAAATGVNASLVHYYFGSKEELFLRVVETTANDAFRTFEAIRRNTASPRDVISLWIENHMLQVELMRKLLKISLDYATTHDRSRRIEAAIRKFYDIEEDVLGKALADGMAEGAFAPCDIARTITFISTFLDGALIRSVMFPSERDAQAKASIAHLRDIILDHLQSGGSRPASEAAAQAV